MLVYFILFRVTDEATLITFKNSQSALRAIAFTGQEVHTSIPMIICDSTHFRWTMYQLMLS